MQTWFPLILGLVLGIFTLIFLFYSSLTIRHAARFRYLSKRTVYLTVFFIALSAALFTLTYLALAILLLN